VLSLPISLRVPPAMLPALLTLVLLVVRRGTPITLAQANESRTMVKCRPMVMV
jgi:hypothetical protein